MAKKLWTTFVSMLKRRLHISIGLMLLAILAITGFQGYWLHKNYKEEEENLKIKTNVLFREAVTGAQFEKLKLDSSFELKISATKEAMMMVNRMKGRITFRQTDTGNKELPRKSTVIVSQDYWTAERERRIEKDTAARKIHYVNRPGEAAFIKIMQGVDSLQDSVTVTDVTKKFQSMLNKDKMDLDFAITKSPGVLKEEIFPPDMIAENEITVGFSNPQVFKLKLLDTSTFILKSLSSQILVSFLLVGVTILSFVLLLRNLIQQRKLTQLKNDFISNITHELKTPIATVSVAIEALKNFNALQDPRKTQEYLEISGNELQRLSLLVDKVLKLSMFEKQQIELKEESFDLKQLTDEVVASMRLQFEKYNAHVDVKAHGQSFVIKADRLHVTSVLFNLLDNALKYSKVNPFIHVELKETEGEIELSVTDNGIGISAEHQKKIFEKFYRVPAGDTHNVKGYGLGLSYVAYVVQRHRGSIDLESQLGIGSRFIIKLPPTT